MPKICIVVPCYNEARRIDLAAFGAFAVSNVYVDFIFVNDGSSDDTKAMLSTFASNPVHRAAVLDLPANMGKAEAVRRGMLQAFSSGVYEFAGFWDADLATPLSEINTLYAATAGKHIVMASRWKRLGAKINRRAVRHFLGRVFSTFTSLLLKLPVYDSQCGAKLFSAHTVAIFGETFITRWLFDVELLARYRNASGMAGALAGIVEVPVGEWQEKGGSKLGILHMIKAPMELLRIGLKYNR